MLGRVAWTVALAALAACRPGADAGAAASRSERWIEPTTGMEFVLVHSGVFDMGLALPADTLRPAPVHRVTLTTPFYLASKEVSQAEWSALMGADPSQNAGCDDCPVESVSWNDARAFIDSLSAANPGERFRLPTEAEWEYACRAGSDTRYGLAFDTLTSDMANYDARIPFEGRSSDAFVGQPTPVGSYPPNAWGLYDMVGNVWEWTGGEFCPYGDSAVVDPSATCATDTISIRGGSWYFSADAARCGKRYTHHRDDSGFSLGFRVVREVPARASADEAR